MGFCIEQYALPADLVVELLLMENPNMLVSGYTEGIRFPSREYLKSDQMTVIATKHNKAILDI